ncbi:hypothetical protein SBY92_002411 [Candida maltosa Xu316]
MFSRLRSYSISQDQRPRIVPSERRYSQVDYEVLHSANNHSAVASSSQSSSQPNSEDLSPLTTTQTNQSVALSDAETLYLDRSHGLELQENYMDNFTIQMRLRESDTRRRRSGNHDDTTTSTETSLGNGTGDTGNGGSVTNNESNIPPHVLMVGDDTFDDRSTIHEETHLPVETFASAFYKIMDKELSQYSVKRSFELVGGMLKSNNYIFPSKESFESFKALRQNIKRDRKNSILVYDKQGTIKKVSSCTKKEDLVGDEDIVIDDRPHIIPLDQKIKGLGLPLFKMQTPYLSSFRKNTPMIIFKKYREIPSSPQQTTSNNKNVVSEDAPDFETYEFCSVYSRYFQNYRRFIMEFNPIDQPSFKVIVFQSNFRSFTDFKYKNTRFRVLGTSVIQGVVQQYNPHMRLLVLDEDMPSLVDNVVNKKNSGGIIKRKSQEPMVKFDYNDYNTYINPISNTSFAEEISSGPVSSFDITSNHLPPFGMFKDAMSRMLPKKYLEVGRFEIYQDHDTLNGISLDTTLSVDLDSLVLLCVMATLRDVSIRNSSKTTAPGGVGFGSRFGVPVAASPGLFSF